MAPRISIVIPTFHRVRQLSRLLDSIASQALPQDQFETLIVSNFRDKELQLSASAKNMPNARVIELGEKGANRSRNRGIAESAGSIVLLLDDDCVLSNERYLDSILRAHEKFPEALAIGGAYSITAGSSSADIAYNLIAKEWQMLGTSCGSQETLRLIGGNVSYKRAELLATGELFNPDILYGGAELEFHARLAAKGAKLIFEPTLTVHHIPEIKGSDLAKKARKQAMTPLRFGIQDPDRGSALGFQPLRHIMALQYSQSEQELIEIFRLMAQYDQAFGSVTGAKDSPFFSFRRKERVLP